MNRPFRVLGLQQVAIGNLQLQPLTHLWCDLLGLTKLGEARNERENVEEVTLELGSGDSAVAVDLMTPIDPAGTPKVHRPALNHIGLWVDDVTSAQQWLEEQGVRFTPGGIRPGSRGHRVCFIHPKASDAFPLSGEGVLIELVQAPDEMLSD